MAVYNQPHWWLMQIIRRSLSTICVCATKYQIQMILTDLRLCRIYCTTSPIAHIPCEACRPFHSSQRMYGGTQKVLACILTNHPVTKWHGMYKKYIYKKLSNIYYNIMAPVQLGLMSHQQHHEPAHSNWCTAHTPKALTAAAYTKYENETKKSSQFLWARPTKRTQQRIIYIFVVVGRIQGRCILNNEMKKKMFFILSKHFKIV